MPSCVVKWCKNNTTLQKKCQGITFHRFPTGNEPWKNDWVRIIRNCRGQEDWVSSKSSVVCSIHFDQNDLYTTPKGRHRVVTYAVPKLLLFEPPVQEEQPDVEPETTSSVQVVHCDHDQEQQSSLGSDQLLFESPLKEEQPDVEPKTTSSLQAVHCDHDQEQQSSLGSDQLLFESPLKEEQPDVEPKTTSSLQAVHCDHDQEQQSSLGSDQAPPPSTILRIVSEKPSGSCTPSSFAQIPPHPTIGLLWDTPRNLRLKKIINKKNTLIKTHRKKIKSLNQKVRRLRNRNQSLKDILKNLKQDNLVNTKS